MIFALDTDIFTLLIQGHEKVSTHHARIIASADDEVTVPAMVRIEVLSGRFDAVKKAADGADLMIAYDRLMRTEAALSAYRTLPVTQTAADHFDRLRANKKLKRIGRGDLLIACIALAHSATLVTRNRHDFARIPGLTVQNWAS